VADVEPALHQ